MKNKIIAAVCLFAVMAALLLIPRGVNAAESESQRYKVYFDVIDEYGKRYRMTCDYTTDGSYYLIAVWKYGSSYSAIGFCWYNPTTGDCYSPVNLKLCPDTITLHAYTIMDYYDDGSTSVPQQYPTVMTGTLPLVKLVDVNKIPVFKINTEDMGTDVEFYFHERYTAGELDMIAGFDYWNNGNKYDYQSKYSASVVAPEIRNAYLYTNRGGDVGGLLIRYLLPELEDNSEYYTELWADIPTGYDSNGNVTYRKVCLKTYKAADILKINTVNSSTHNTTDPNDETIDYDYTATYGSYYLIKEQWSTILPMISVDEAAAYGGITFYLRSALHLSDSVSLVSDYAYFRADPNASLYPTIYNGNGQNFNEEDANINDDTDPQTPNSDDIQYIGGTTDDPGISSDVSSDSSHSSSGGRWQYNFAGNWEVSDMENWVNTGFGLSGSNGLLGFIGNCFFYLPSEFMSILIFVVMVVAVVAIVKIIRGM